MKRLFILSAAVAALASCSNSEVITEVNEPQVPDKAIAFETFSSNATRAEGDPTSENSGQTADKTDGLNLHHNSFQVWGYKDVQSTGYVFDRVTVSYSSGKWVYSPIHFWDKNANKYEFYACAPATASDATSSFTLNKVSEASIQTQANEYFTINDVTLKNVTSSSNTYVHSMKDDQVTNTVTEGVTSRADVHYPQANIDYMIANACKVEQSAFGHDVQLYFNHILSRLNITVKKGETLSSASAKLDVVSLQVFNMVSKGSFDESDADNSNGGTTLSSGTTKRWDPSTEEGDKVTYVANALNDVKDSYTSTSTDGNYILQSLVIPQKIKYEEIKLDGSTSSLSQPYMKIVYVITTGTGNDTNTETYTAYYNLAAAFGAVKSSQVTAGGNEYSEVAFNEGWQNTLNITIDADAITFEPKVYEWKDGSNYDFEIGKVLPNP